MNILQKWTLFDRKLNGVQCVFPLGEKSPKILRRAGEILTIAELIIEFEVMIDVDVDVDVHCGFVEPISMTRSSLLSAVKFNNLLSVLY